MRRVGRRQAAALTYKQQRKTKEAVAEIRKFHHQLCQTRVLDPACGSGNFLYVTLEHMKRLEGEVLEVLGSIVKSGSFELEGLTVDPHQFLGMEINPRAAKIAEIAEIAEMVLGLATCNGNSAPTARSTRPTPGLPTIHSVGLTHRRHSCHELAHCCRPRYDSRPGAGRPTPTNVPACGF